MAGGTLSSILGDGPYMLPLAARTFAQVSSALSYAHRHGVIHCDIKLANILRDGNGNAFLSDFGIAQDGVRRAVGGFSLGYAPPEQRDGAPATPQIDIYSLGVVLFELLTGTRAFGDDPAQIDQRQRAGPLPSICHHCPQLPPELDAAIQRALAPNPDDRYADVASFSAAVGEALAAALRATGLSSQASIEAVQPPGLPDVPNPYRGLEPFGEADAALFEGRTALTRRLIDRLGESRNDARFLAVVGPSGSGKSSVVRAGLIPALRQESLPHTALWYIAVMTPGTQPVESLAAALEDVAPRTVPDLYAQLYASERGLLTLVDSLLPPDPAVELLLVIDQFEELYTQLSDSALRLHLLESLMAAIYDPQSRLRVVVTLRADFYDRPLSEPGFGTLLQARSEWVLPLDERELTDAIVKPALQMGVRPEPSLVREILADVEEQPGALPLLQYALRDIFEQRDGDLMTLARYQARGGVQGTLARRADEIYTSLTPVQQDLARQLFLRLIMPGEGTEDTRRRVRHAELAALLQRPSGHPYAAAIHTTVAEAVAATPTARHAPAAEMEPDNPIDVSAPTARVASVFEEHDLIYVLEQYGQVRLLTFDHEPDTRLPTVEVAHEALLRAWPRLRGWLDAARDDLRIQRRLGELAGEWERQSRDPEYLAWGGLLLQFEELERGDNLALNQLERDFLATSRVERQRQEMAEQERQSRELRQARALAEEQQQRAEVQAVAARRLRRRATLLGAGAPGDGGCRLVWNRVTSSGQCSPGSATGSTGDNPG
jgi:hypothetical protein